MKKYFKVVCVILSAGIFTGTINQALADSPYEKNKMPCLEGICIGDDIRSLQNISWTPVDKLLGAKQYEGWKIVGDPKSLQKLLPYLSGRVIDKKGISLLPQIKGFCTRPYGNPIFSGEYKGKDGKPVNVTFGLVTSADYKSQKIIVSDIIKRISTTKDISSIQIQSLNAEMKKRYPNSNKGLSTTVAYVGTSFSSNDVFSRVYYRSGFDNSDESTALLEFPGCTKKVEL